MGSNWVKGHRVSRSKVKFVFFFCLFPNFSQVLGPIFTKLGGKVEGGPGGVHFFKGQGHRGQRSNFCISAVLAPICMKLGECIQVDPYISSRGWILARGVHFLKVKVIEVKGQISVSRQSLVRFA